MQPDDICVVDRNGNQLEGHRRRTSEVQLHLAIYQERTDINAVVHCHPPHATAFSVAREPIPNCVLPEPDIFLGEVPVAPYETPGDKGLADAIRPFINSTNTIILANHGTVSYQTDVERAFWLTEILDSYCRILILAKHIGRIQYLPDCKGLELLRLRQAWGFADERLQMNLAKNEIGGHILFRETWSDSELEQRGFPCYPETEFPSLGHANVEQLVEAIADKVVEKLRIQN
jgi:L-fuculose-phosphate aldolase